jgi:4-hydroxyphenylpyruvate dioxygenase-like putative hemolysin
MKKYICAKCRSADNKPHFHKDLAGAYSAENDDTDLLKANKRVLAERRKYGLDGLVKGLDHLIINTEPDRQVATVEELLRYTGLDLSQAFEDDDAVTYVLRTQGSADLLVTSRKHDENPFLPYNLAPKSEHLPNTRLETLVFLTPDLKKYVDIQKSRGIEFMTDKIAKHTDSLFIQTKPSELTGNSIGFVEWIGEKGNYQSGNSKVDKKGLSKPKLRHLYDIKYLDHIATRVEAKNRDKAIIEFMEVTNYSFEFAIYVKTLNSITSVTRLSKSDFALVFTSGISKEIAEEYVGPTEKFIRNYGLRAHHMAFHTENIDYVFDELKRDGMGFLVELVGSEKEGLKQTFTTGSTNTFMVNEYIHRFGDFDGFFTKSNVELLTRATDKQ